MAQVNTVIHTPAINQLGIPLPYIVNLFVLYSYRSSPPFIWDTQRWIEIYTTRNNRQLSSVPVYRVLYLIACIITELCACALDQSGWSFKAKCTDPNSLYWLDVNKMMTYHSLARLMIYFMYKMYQSSLLFSVWNLRNWPPLSQLSAKVNTSQACCASDSFRSLTPFCQLLCAFFWNVCIITLFCFKYIDHSDVIKFIWIYIYHDHQYRCSGYIYLCRSEW